MVRIGGGDREALRRLFNQYRLPLFALAVRMVGDHGAAEELLQDCFVRIWRSAGTYDAHQSQPFTWTVTILRRMSSDHLRRRRPEIADVDAAESPTEDSVRATVVRHEMSEQVSRALGHLSEGPRAALELSLFSGLTHEEIANRLRLPLGTAKAWIRRGLVALRGELQDFSR
jgi:RNA polymerase sigma-70 factor (ECF subfamily)